MSPAISPRPARGAAALRHRRSARRLTAGQLADFRAAITPAQAIKDDRGFQYWAGIHGLPLPISCTHHTELFLPWHRAYLYFFEKALQDRVPGVTLPWWDWTAGTRRRDPGGLRATAGPDGKRNPLFDSPIQPARPRTPEPEADHPRARPPGPAADREPRSTACSRTATSSPSRPSWRASTTASTSGSAARWASIATAAYDPIFWAHHCMIDRLWYLWQLRHPGAGVPARAARPGAAAVPDDGRATRST